VPTTITIPWVKSQTQGYQRMRLVQLLTEQQDDCGLKIELAFNYDATVKQTAQWTADDLRSLRNKGLVEVRVAAAYCKQMAVQIKVSDTQGTSMTTGQGARFVSACLDLQNLGPRYKLLGAAARR
jgi:hypothetical protein